MTFHFPIIVLLQVLLQLLDKPFPLVHGIIQFGESIGDLLSRYIEFEAIDQIRMGLISPGKGRDIGGIMGDERRLDEVWFHDFIQYLDEDFPMGNPAFQVNTRPLSIFKRPIVVTEGFGIDFSPLNDSLFNG